MSCSKNHYPAIGVAVAATLAVFAALAGVLALGVALPSRKRSTSPASPSAAKARVRDSSRNRSGSPSTTKRKTCTSSTQATSAWRSSLRMGFSSRKSHRLVALRIPNRSRSITPATP